ncbi:MAG: efflux RND transporter periplasmic adaptor subunit [Spirosomataceae bacterium]
MKFLSIIAFAGLMLTVVACGDKEDNSLDGKKAKLVALQSQQAEILATIKTLQAEIEKAEPNKSVKIKSVSTMPIVAQQFDHFVEATGRLDAVNNVLVSPQMGGAITALYVKEGDMVTKGQRIATIDNTVMRNSIQEIMIQLETAKTLFERQKALWDQKIGTEVQYIQAKAQVESIEKRLSTLKSQDAMNVVLAPISGQIDEVRMKSGEMAAPGIGIVRIVNSANLKVVASVPDTYAGTIAKGDVVQIRFPDLNREMTARLTFVGQTINPASRTFPVEAQLSSVDRQLKPNLTAELKINDQSRAGVIAIPQNIVQRTEQGTVVYVAVKEGNQFVAKQRVISTGLSYDGKVEVLTGLTAGDLLISEGYQELVDGQVVSF